ncbi:hypothetical protein DLAC_06658 [Tieghemostelium lacteum]|uniref:Phytanoyl-CoA dioxygenase n=1 Tax=Tieghemostelium lacteum TaxID=361077 RepID=A0A151ZFM2_TIELA|nr:hypothetical protein DLAC_06658 [Tieghemostelium lacteum]|eukprot:KYQ92664.1 hypothetical protein DLAC_06658 [Tieghemostelium lacteum]
MYQQKLLSVLVVLISLTTYCKCTTVIEDSGSATWANFLPYSDYKCTGSIEGFGIASQLDICVQGWYTDQPFGFEISQVDSTTLENNIYNYNDQCNRRGYNATDYTIGDCKDSNFDASQQFYYVEVNSQPYIEKGSVLYTFYDSSCETIQAYLYITPGTSYYPSNDQYTEYSCDKGSPLAQNCGLNPVTDQWTCSKIMIKNNEKVDLEISKTLYQVSDKEIEKFKNDGFLIIDNIISKENADRLRSRIEPLFNGEFETKVYPDEWYYRKGLSREDITREMVNSYKCDRSIAQLVLSEKMGKLVCDLMGWQGCRVSQDDIFWKPVSGKPIGFHQDEPYMRFFTTSEVCTVWVALTDVSLENGTLEYAKSSHLWDKANSEMTNQFHAPEHYKLNLEEASRIQGVDKVDIVPVQVEKGGCSIHHGLTYHGSATNPSQSKERVSIAIHYIPSESEFKENCEIGYIYGRYKIFNSLKLEESFFPITYSRNGYKSPCINQLIFK